MTLREPEPADVELIEALRAMTGAPPGDVKAVREHVLTFVRTLRTFVVAERYMVTTFNDEDAGYAEEQRAQAAYLEASTNADIVLRSLAKERPIPGQLCPRCRIREVKKKSRRGGRRQ